MLQAPGELPYGKPFTMQFEVTNSSSVSYFCRPDDLTGSRSSVRRNTLLKKMQQLQSVKDVCATIVVHDDVCYGNEHSFCGRYSLG